MWRDSSKLENVERFLRILGKNQGLEHAVEHFQDNSVPGFDVSDSHTIHIGVHKEFVDLASSIVSNFESSGGDKRLGHGGSPIQGH
jgi:hypothetical protein